MKLIDLNSFYFQFSISNRFKYWLIWFIVVARHLVCATATKLTLFKVDDKSIKSNLIVMSLYALPLSEG